MASRSFRNAGQPSSSPLLSLSVNQDSSCVSVGTTQGLSIFSLETGALLHKNASLGALG